MPYVIVELLQGRTVDQKRAAGKAITDAVCEHLNVKPESVHVLFHELKRDDLATAGKLHIDS